MHASRQLPRPICQRVVVVLCSFAVPTLQVARLVCHRDARDFQVAVTMSTYVGTGDGKRAEPELGLVGRDIIGIPMAIVEVVSGCMQSAVSRRDG